ncbi:MAG: hypothetical protein E6G94_11905 [Alphaproteobacteria bacterium]|nr:MAG: hypothetical protein E6G94_11905 [Alphaproteobacteria bacterium]
MAALIAVAPVAAMSAPRTAPAPARSPSADKLSGDVQEAMAWLASLSDAVGGQVQAGKQLFDEMQRVTSTAKSREDWQAAAPRFRSWPRGFRTPRSGARNRSRHFARFPNPT